MSLPRHVRTDDPDLCVSGAVDHQAAERRARLRRLRAAARADTIHTPRSSMSYRRPSHTQQVWETVILTVLVCLVIVLAGLSM